MNWYKQAFRNDYEKLYKYLTNIVFKKVKNILSQDNAIENIIKEMKETDEDNIEIIIPLESLLFGEEYMPKNLLALPPQKIYNIKSICITINIEENGSKIYTGGSANWNNEIKIDIHIPKDIIYKDFPYLYERIYKTISHEVIHIKQYNNYNKDNIINQRPNTHQWKKELQHNSTEKENWFLRRLNRYPTVKDLNKEIYNTFSYLMKPVEIEAFSVMFYKMSVLRKMPYNAVLDSELGSYTLYHEDFLSELKTMILVGMFEDFKKDNVMSNIRILREGNKIYTYFRKIIEKFHLYYKDIIVRNIHNKFPESIHHNWDMEPFSETNKENVFA